MAPPMLRREFIFSQPDNYRQEARLRTQIQNDIISTFLVFPPPLTLNFVTSPLHCSQLLVFPTILFHTASLQSCGQLTPLCEATDNQIPLSIKLTDWDIFPCTLWFFQLNPTHQVDPWFSSALPRWTKDLFSNNVCSEAPEGFSVNIKIEKYV